MAKMGWRGFAKRTSEENAWWSARQRCYNPKNPNYHRYGGRGIYMDDYWVGGEDGLEQFLRDMGPKPGPEYSLDRIDNDGPYAVWNCRWATSKEQSNNKSNNVWRIGHIWERHDA